MLDLAESSDGGLFVLFTSHREVRQLASELRARGAERRWPLLVHGDEDDLIPAPALFLAAEGLAALGIPAEWHLSHGIGHGIDAEGLRHGGEFLKQRFGLRP